MPVLFVVLLAVILSGVGQLLLKHGVDSVENVDFANSLFRTYVRMFASPLVLAGAFTYFFSALMYMYALTKFDLSFAYPLVAIGYIITTVGAKLLLGEEISLVRWSGIVVICVGVYLITRS